MENSGKRNKFENIFFTFFVSNFDENSRLAQKKVQKIHRRIFRDRDKKKRTYNKSNSADTHAHCKQNVSTRKF